MHSVGDGPGRQPTQAPRTNPPLHSHRIPSFRFRLPPHSGLAQVFSTLSGCLNGLPLEDRLIPDARNCHFRLKFLAPLVAHWRSVSCSHTYPAPQLTHYALSRSQIPRTRVRSHPLGPGGGPVHAGHGLVQAADVLRWPGDHRGPPRPRDELSGRLRQQPRSRSPTASSPRPTDPGEGVIAVIFPHLMRSLVCPVGPGGETCEGAWVCGRGDHPP